MVHTQNQDIWGLNRMNEKDKEFLINLLSDILQGNNKIAINKIKTYRILNDFWQNSLIFLTIANK